MFLEDKVIRNDPSECQFCLNMKRELQIMHEELKSARLIIKILQTEGNTVNTTIITTNQALNYDTSDINSNVWKPVSTNKVRVKRLIPVQQPQSIPTKVNRYKVLDNLHSHLLTHQQCKHANSLLVAQKECSGTAYSVSVSVTQQTKGKEDCSKKTQDRKRNRIVIIGDSHARGCAQKI